MNMQGSRTDESVKDRPPAQQVNQLAQINFDIDIIMAGAKLTELLVEEPKLEEIFNKEGAAALDKIHELNDREIDRLVADAAQQLINQGRQSQ